jgi:uncharacterized membrane protein SpoIIM required for sporulation
MMNYCPNCGARLMEGQNFCRSCGLDLRARAGAEASGQRGAMPHVRGASSNAVYYVTRDGLRGVRVLPPLTIALCALLPLPVLAVLGVVFQLDSAAIYIVVWLVLVVLLYDEMKWRRLRKLEGLAPEEMTTARKTWMIAWRSIWKASWDGGTLTASSPDRLRTAITFDDANSATVEGSLAVWGVPLRRKQAGRTARIFRSFLALVVILFVISQGILISAAVLPFFPGEEQVYTSALNHIQGNLTNTSLLQQFELIFSNNLQVATVNMLPGLGALTFGAASYNTGRIIQVIGLHQRVPAILVVLSLYLYPHSWVEELSYPAATAAGIMLITSWRRLSPERFSRRANRGSVKFALALGGVAVQLTVAGFLEVVEPGLGVYVLLLWIPVAAGAILFVAWRQRTRSRRGRPAPPAV